MTDEQRIIAMNQRWAVLNKMSEQGLVELIAHKYGEIAFSADKDHLVFEVLEYEYGLPDAIEFWERSK